MPNLFRFWPWEQGVLPTRECISCNLLWISWSQLSCQRFKIYFTLKGLKSVQGIEQFDIRLSNAFLASWSPTVRVPMDIYMTRDPCENDMLTDGNILYKIQLFFKGKGFEFCNFKLPIGRKESSNRSWLFSYQKRQRTSFEARSTGIPLSSALKIDRKFPLIRWIPLKYRSF